MGEALLELIARFVVNLLLLPICIVVATPIVVVFAIFGSDSYLSNVRNGYMSVVRFWDRWLWIVP